jgi:hypothetical protein
MTDAATSLARGSTRATESSGGSAGPLRVTLTAFSFASVRRPTLPLLGSLLAFYAVSSLSGEAFVPRLRGALVCPQSRVTKTVSKSDRCPLSSGIATTRVGSIAPIDGRRLNARSRVLPFAGGSSRRVVISGPCLKLAVRQRL